MKTTENKVKKASEYFFYTPSAQAENLFFFPLVLGHYFYEKDYFIQRESFDSFLIMHILHGQCTIHSQDSSFLAESGQTVFLDCYQPHSYGSNQEWEALWIHFDGPMAEKYYEMITQRSNLIFSHKASASFEADLKKLYQYFFNRETPNEAIMSEQITHLLTQLILSAQKSQKMTSYSKVISESTQYIREHLHESNLSLNELAAQIHLSPYYYTRLFKRETGFTPHEYIIRSRIHLAKFLLKSTNETIKEICFQCGFYSESAFCNTFQKWEKISPGKWRQNHINSSS